MSYRQDIAGCRAAVLGEHGLDDKAWRAQLNAARPALDWLRAHYADRSLPLLHLPAARADLDALAPLAKRYREFDAVVVLGTGGSSLGGAAVAALLGDPARAAAGRPALHFADNIDPTSFDALLGALPLARTGFLVVSKSGSTAETMTQFLIALEALIAAEGKTAPGRQMTVIAEPGDNVLRRVAGAHGMTALDHDPKVGGRYSVLSLVGLLPALIAGQDAFALRQGALEVLNATLGAAVPADAPAAVGAALSVAFARERGASQMVLLHYSDILTKFGLWYRQLWAESLGKDGQGTTPVPAVGAVDQHSQLQLYLAGPRDKLYTLVLIDRAGTGHRVSPALAADPALAYLAGRTMGDLMEAEQRATADTLVRNGRPVRVLRLQRLDERALGAMMMHFMLETILAARLMGVDPFDQPAVEEGKVLARNYLGEMAQGKVTKT
ncbi:MAG TPA: glucose-6-phosphate isomerase [Alphaproteobacteria bacterium]|nr:glucose-6-phosphate isomerase [Alphaproteobacteria bacterium]